MTNITVATFTEGVKVVQTEPLHQYDYGQILRFVGIDDAMDSSDNYEVHFSNSGLSGSAKAVVGGSSGVIIPDEYLASGADIHAWIYTHTGASDEDEEYTDGRTSYEVIIPVLKRARPSDMPPTPTGRDTMMSDIIELQGDVHDINESIDGITGDIGDINESIDGITGDIGDINDDIDDLTPRVATLEQKTSAVSQDSNHFVLTNTHVDIPHGDINVGTDQKSGEAGMYMETNAKKIKILASSNGNCGIYDNTASAWIFQKASNGVLYLNRNGTTWSKNADDGAERPVVGGSGVGDNAVAYFSSWATGLGVYARFGTSSFSTISVQLVPSDVRLKENIQPAEKSGLELIKKLDVKQFDWKTSGKHWDFGVIAQEAREIDENIVSGEEKEDSYLGIDTLYMVDVLIKAVQELSAEVELLKAKLEDRGVVD